jgi:hypothetical protein
MCSSLVQHAEANAFNVFFYFCSYLGTSSGSTSHLLRSLISQIIQKHQDLAVYVHDVYFKSYPVPSKKALLVLLPELLQGLGSTRLIIDGIDEWDADEQKELLKDLMQLLSTDSSSYICKILIASRDTLEVSRNIRKNKSVVTMSLSERDESLAIAQSIEKFVDKRLNELPDHFNILDPDGLILSEIKSSLSDKSNGIILLDFDRKSLIASRYVSVGTTGFGLARIYLQS